MFWLGLLLIGEGFNSFGVEIIKDERGRLCLVVGGGCEKKQGRRI